MRPCSKTLVGLLVVALMVSSSGAIDKEATPDEILRSINELSSPGTDVVRNAHNRLVGVRSHEGITAILESLQSASPPVRTTLCEILGTIGEPAVEVVFAGSVPEPATGKRPVPWANHVLTNYLKTDAIPFLLKKVKNGETEERKVAAWAIWSITHYCGIGESKPTDVIAPLLEAAVKDPVPYVKQYSADALCNINDEASIPALVNVLSDEMVGGKACEGLAKFGEKASEAIPALKRGIEQRRLPAKAFDALIAIEGRAAVPFVVEQLATWRFGPNDRGEISSALLRQPHPEAIPFMQEELWNGNSSSRVGAALFFSALDHQASLENLRKCLTVFPKEKDECTHPLDTGVSCAQSLRAIAARYLVAHRDTNSYDKILAMLEDDPSIKVRTAAAQAFGKAQYEKAIPALKGCFDTVDEGRAAIGHQDGDLHAAAVDALGKIGTEEAHRVLYAGITEGQAEKHCVRFWLQAKDRAAFERFLMLFQKSLVDEKTAAGIIASQLWTHREHYALPKQSIADAEKNFLANVRDEKHFCDDVDLSDGGQKNVTVDFTFYTIDFVSVSFKFTLKRSRGYSHGYTILYRKVGESWKPMGKTSEFVT